MGGAVALMGLEEPGAMQAVVADSPYADLHTMTLDYYGFLPVANHALAFWTDILTRLTFGTSLADVSPLNAAAKSTTPLLLIHGREDRTIPVSHFYRLKDALTEHPSAEFWLVENAGHTDAYGLEGDHYRERVLDFFQRYLVETSEAVPTIAAKVEAPTLLSAARELGPDVLNGDTSGFEQHE
jgi:dipeptidyl aminopeptidase/acylaminoacyl peptidase